LKKKSATFSRLRRISDLDEKAYLSILVSRRTRFESFGPLSRHSKFIVKGVLGATVAFEIVISRILGKLTKFGAAIKSGVLIK
jgi:hypothetical protein